MSPLWVTGTGGVKTLPPVTLTPKILDKAKMETVKNKKVNRNVLRFGKRDKFMRLAIKNENMSIVVTANRELTIQEVVSAQQLVTGNFEALFVESEETEAAESMIDSMKEHKEAVITAGKKWYDKGQDIGISVMCPVCGMSKEIKGRYGYRYTNCPGCRTKLNNSPAVHGMGYGFEDDRGNLYHAFDVYRTTDDQFGSSDLFEVPADD